jgi:hypothetical protein
VSETLLQHLARLGVALLRAQIIGGVQIRRHERWIERDRLGECRLCRVSRRSRD